MNNIRRRYLSKIKKFFVLADYIAQNAPRIPGIEFSTIPLIFQPDYPSVPVEKPDGEIWIAVPGGVSFSRRDYIALVPPEGKKYSRNIKFIILGRSNREKTATLHNALKERGIEDNFVFFETFVENAEFQSWVKKCDYVMPLIHEKCEAFEDYLSVKITGNLNVALTYRKPMLCDVAFRRIPEYAEHSIFYHRDGLCDMVNGLVIPETKEYYDDDFERTHSIDVLAEKYNAFLQLKE